MIKRYGTPPKHGQSYRLRPGAYGVLWNGVQLLTTYQGAPHWELQLPGGGIDPGESPLQALHREILEETGWRICGPRRLGALRRFTYMPEYDLYAEKLCHIYFARPTLQMGPPIEVDHTPVWSTLEEAIDLLANPEDSKFVADFFRVR